MIITLDKIENYRIIDLSQYLFDQSDYSKKIASKYINELTDQDLLYLIRRRNYLEIAVLISTTIFQKKGFYGYSFNHDEKSITQQDLLKEITLLDSDFWNYNQFAYLIFKPIVQKHYYHLKISKVISDLFLQIEPKPIICKESHIEWIKSNLAENSASSVHSAFEMIRKLKRAINEGIEINLQKKNGIVKIGNDENLINEIINDLQFKSDIEKVINKEIKIKY